MAETKKKTAAKPIAIAKKKADAKPKKNSGARSMQPAIVAHEEIEKLAHRFWAERGYEHGQAQTDWFRAEQALRGKAS